MDHSCGFPDEKEREELKEKGSWSIRGLSVMDTDHILNTSTSVPMSTASVVDSGVQHISFYFSFSSNRS